MVDFRLGRLENTAPVHKSKLRKRVDFDFGPGGPQEARVVFGVCFLIVFAENVVKVVDFRLGGSKTLRLCTNPSLENVSIFILARVGPGVLFGVLLGGLLESFGTPWGTLGSLWATLESLGIALACYGVLWDVPWVPFCETWTFF